MVSRVVCEGWLVGFVSTVDEYVCSSGLVSGVGEQVQFVGLSSRVGWEEVFMVGEEGWLGGLFTKVVGYKGVCRVSQEDW